MNASRLKDLDRLNELLADEAAAALDAADQPELAGLLAKHGEVSRDEFLATAALAQVAFLRREGRQRPGTPGAGRMPAGLKARLASQGQSVALRRPVLVPQPAAPKPAAVNPVRAGTSSNPQAILGYLGWALAAALAVALIVPRGAVPVAEPALDRAALVNNAPDRIIVPWAPPTAPGYEQVKGDVVWSPSRQQGYLRLANMPVNDPARVQYQLWIVDPDRDKHPVDGGVFNVSATGEVVIPIQAKLLIRSPKAFAITAEQPGGVVVSAGPLLVVAAT